ncbi:4Fe-4S double cluster binding domain-containing protein [Methanospirillum hungatei]|uniref:4Fe-4S double cluster binding domain-containing protein n=1 Tax=Methanospirillum hungatei TaxID=2203 RepID=UPI0026EC5204|nr:4Fe-4S double cluster binding domain-containing protein [Methanospirillum hungatei]
MLFTKPVFDTARRMGAYYCGFADISALTSSIPDLEGYRVHDYPAAVSVGIALSDQIINSLPNRDDVSVYQAYCRHYDETNHHLDSIATEICSIIEDFGYKTYHVPASSPRGPDGLTSEFSHKIAAHQAGHGWIGKSALLITPEHGPRVRWVTVLISAPIHQEKEPMDEQCGRCKACTQICPVHAISGIPFDAEDPGAFRFDREACNRGFSDRKKMGLLAICGLCVYVCPYGKRSTNNEAYTSK